MDSGTKEVSRSYTPLAFYLDSDVDYPAPILKMDKSVTKNSIPLSCYTTILVYHHSPTGDESKMDIFVTNQQNNYRTLSFYMDPTISHPGLRINYIPKSSTAAVSNSSSQSKVTFSCFGSQSVAANVSKNYIPLSFFGSFGSQSSQSKVIKSSQSKEFMVVPPSPAELVPMHPYDGYLEHFFHGFGYDQFRDDFKVIQSIDHQDALTLVSFDLSDEVFLTIPIGEEPYSPYSRNRRLTVLNGSIALISNYHDDIVFHISILGELSVNSVGSEHFPEWRAF
ncbi:F-box protein [Trifolium pratense]|uniref:F-box protein n=1 Tax=Trifolium pratense TaxID=57577 RepID=A0A2K3L8R9_TRIPR|nr:F-box protein [Trifolium pratense]